jgi:hypothetical protein
MEARAFWISTLATSFVLAVISRLVSLFPRIGSSLFGEVGGAVVSRPELTLPPIGSFIFLEIGNIAITWTLICLFVQVAGVAFCRQALQPNNADRKGMIGQHLLPPK